MHVLSVLFLSMGVDTTYAITHLGNIWTDYKGLLYPISVGLRPPLAPMS